MTDPLAAIEGELRASRKYRHLSAETVQRVAHWALARYPSPKEAVKAAKRKLHQVFAAYCVPDHVGRLADEVERLPSPDDRDGCRHLLAQHASTRERLDLLDQLYPALWQQIGQPRCILDLACGYHPFALPWMGLDGAEYHCCDIDERLAAAVNAYLHRLGRPATACCKDLLAGPPRVAADVALLFKTAPCLEQQEKGSAVALLRSLDARWAVVSFPLESLGGKGKGMREHYAAMMAEIAGELGAPTRAVEFPNEVFYLVEIGNRPARPGGAA